MSAYTLSVHDRCQHPGARSSFRIRPLTRLITSGRHFQSERLVRSFGIIDVAPLIEVVLAARQIVGLEIAQDFGLERTMKPFVLTLGLRMMGSRMRNSNSQLH